MDVSVIFNGRGVQSDYKGDNFNKDLFGGLHRHVTAPRFCFSEIGIGRDVNFSESVTSAAHAF